MSADNNTTNEVSAVINSLIEKQLQKIYRFDERTRRIFERDSFISLNRMMERGELNTTLQAYYEVKGAISKVLT